MNNVRLQIGSSANYGRRISPRSRVGLQNGGSTSRQMTVGLLFFLVRTLSGNPGFPEDGFLQRWMLVGHDCLEVLP
jgi:hypothetical protein